MCLLLRREKCEDRRKYMTALQAQTIETKYKDVNILASQLRQAGAVINIAKIQSDIFSITIKQPPKIISIEEILTNVAVVDKANDKLTDRENSFSTKNTNVNVAPRAENLITDKTVSTNTRKAKSKQSKSRKQTVEEVNLSKSEKQLPSKDNFSLVEDDIPF